MVNENLCPIWGTPAQSYATGGFDGRLVSSARAGYSATYATPTYKITRTAEFQLKSELHPILRSSEVQRGLTNWIVSRHLAGEALPLVTSDIVIQSAAFTSLTYGQRKERLLRLLRDRRFEIGDKLRANEDALLPLLDFTEPHQVTSFFALLTESRILKFVGLGDFEIDVEGLNLLEANSVNSSKVFIAMWFDGSLDVAAAAISTAIRSCKLEPVRIDKVEHADKICDRIIAEIRSSKFVIADFTCGIVKSSNKDFTVPRGGVYYEAGFAQGLGKQVIWTCREDQIKDVHFDTRQYAHIVWKDEEELSTKLETRIRALGLNG
jgi:hypothetical protein